MSNRNCRPNCTFLSIAAAVIAAVAAAILQYTAVITLTPVFYIVAFGIAIAYLAVTLVTATALRNTAADCVCDILSVLLTGILGTILTSVILLAVGFAATSVLGAIIVGALAGFFTLTVGTVACLAKCVVNTCNHDY